MKKCAIVIVAMLMSLLYASPAFAIEDPDPKGTLRLGLQTGIRTGACIEFYLDIDENLDFNIGNEGDFMLGLATMLTADYVLVDSWWKGHFTVGTMLGGYRIGTIGSGEKRHHSAFVVAPRAMYGLNLSRRWEVHTGFAVGIAFQGCSVKCDFHTGPDFVFCPVTGARFNITDGFAVTADFNLSGHMPLASLGVGIRF